MLRTSLVPMVSGFIVLFALGCDESHSRTPEDGGVDGGEVDGSSDASVDARAEHFATCDRLCAHNAECDNDCNFDEDPNCDEEELYDQLYQACDGDCREGLSLRPEPCVAATSDFAGCAVGDACGDVCSHEERSYLEQCVFHPGFLVCENVCAELEIGCIPYETIGLRGASCKVNCEAPAQDIDCLNALYELDECSPDLAYGCEPISDACLLKVANVVEKCDSLETATLDTDEVSACQSFATQQCACNFWFEIDDCELRSERRCLFALGRGSVCADAIDAFQTCMESVETCSRETLRDECEAEWNAYSAACG
ncbi:MAG: hypothetical protein R3A78_04580 [Polyangiales bacterium]